MNLALFISGLFFFIRVQRIHTFIQIENITFDFDGSTAVKITKIYHQAYAIDALTIGSLENDKVKLLKTHLGAAMRRLRDSPVRSIFLYLYILCNEYVNLQKLRRITNDVNNFIVKTVGQTNNAVEVTKYSNKDKSISQMIKSGGLFSTSEIHLGKGKMIKAIFDKYEARGKMNEEERIRSLPKASAAKREIITEEIALKQKAAIKLAKIENTLGKKLSNITSKSSEKGIEKMKNIINKAQGKQEKIHKKISSGLEKNLECFKNEKDDWQNTVWDRRKTTTGSGSIVIGPGVENVKNIVNITRGKRGEVYEKVGVELKKNSKLSTKEENLGSKTNYGGKTWNSNGSIMIGTFPTKKIPRRW